MNRTYSGSYLSGFFMVTIPSHQIWIQVIARILSILGENGLHRGYKGQHSRLNSYFCVAMNRTLSSYHHLRGYPINNLFHKYVTAVFGINGV